MPISPPGRDNATSCVREILKKLPARDCQIRRLVFLEEAEKDEVYRICQVDRHYLRVLLHRAKNRFREGTPKAKMAFIGAF